ncbi:MAG: hypothetical protein SOI44_07480 [Lactimicrobium sp.]|jgi:type VI protein secretion system component VasK|uniref:hypothetical protein n=1 Tax=Lactimicrobium sp. TaxID=2563780 RepID=UPI002F356C52
MEIDAIQKLIDTDEKVRQEVKDVYDRRAQLKQAIVDEEKKMSDDAWAAVNARVESTKAELEEKVKADDAQNQAYYSKASADLQKQFDASHEKWRKELYKRIVEDHA